MNKTAQAAPDAPQEGQPQVPLRIKETKKFGITGLEKQTLQNFLDIQAINNFNLRAHLQLIGAARLGIQDGALVQFDLQLNNNQVVVNFLEPDTNAGQPPAGGSKIEVAPPSGA